MTISAGTYNFTTNEWRNSATYELTLQPNGKIKVTGTIPYDATAGIFPTGGYRFAVRLSNPEITAKSQLPSGDIVKATNTDFAGGYNVGTKSDFENDGTLIAVVAPTAETLGAYDREVKVAWTKAGASVADGDFHTYTFDLSDARLASHE